MRSRQSVTRLGVLLLLGHLAGCAGEEAPEAPRIASIAVDPAQLVLVPGQRGRLVAEVRGEDGGILPTPVRWASSAPEVASVDAAGEVRAHARGEARIQAEAGGRTATAEVEVRDARLVRLEIEPSEPKVVQGESIALEATVYDEIDRPYVGLPISWSSSAPLYASVDEEGVVRGLTMNRSATVTATHGDLEVSVEVEVLAPIFRITVAPPALDLLEGESSSLAATLLDANLETVEPRSLSWQSEDPAIARVDEEGTVTAIAPGETRILALSEGKVGWAPVEVRQRASEIVLDLSPREIRVGGRIPLRAEARDARGARVEDLELEWVVEDGTVAHLLGQAYVEGMAPGTTRIIVRNEAHGVEASAELLVREAASFRLLGPPSEVWAAGDRFSLALEVEVGGELVPPRDPEWFTVDESVATIDAEGKVELVGLGRVNLGVRVEGFEIGIDGSSAVRFVEMALGAQSTCGLAPNGTVWCWGRKLFVEGEETSHLPAWIPEKVAEGVVALRHGKGSCTSLASGASVCDLSYGLREDGSLLALHLGLPPLPVEAPRFVAFDAVEGNLCGRTPSGEIACTGQSLEAPGSPEALLLHPLGHCLLGGGEMRCEGEGPLDVDLSPWSFGAGAPFPLSASREHGCAVDEEGQALCWGANDRGQIEAPPDPPGGLRGPTSVGTEILSVAAAEGVSFLVAADGVATARGTGLQALPGNLSPARLDEGLAAFPRQGEVARVFTGVGQHRCLLLENGRPYCWGANEMGQAAHPPRVDHCGFIIAPVVDPVSPYPEDAPRHLSCEAEFPFFPCVLSASAGSPAPLCCPVAEAEPPCCPDPLCCDEVCPF